MLTRREFLKGAAAGAAGAAVMGLTGAGAFGAEAAVQSAGGWLGEAPAISQDEIAETWETDVLVVGDGSAGAFAAAAAAEEGARVLVIEKNAMAFGIRTDLAAVDSKLQLEGGIQIDHNDIVNNICHYACYDNDQRLVHFWADHSGEAMDWYMDLLAQNNIELFLETYTGNPENRYKAFPVAHGPRPADSAAAQQAVHAYVESLGGEYRYETALVELIREGDRVIGAIAADPNGAYVRINAALGVIVCTGGYAANMDMMQALQPENYIWAGWPCFAAHMMGDGVKACLWAGARMDDLHFSHTFDRIALPPDALGGESSYGVDGLGQMFLMGSQPFLKVNLKGERFMNESCPYDFTNHALLSQPGHCLAMIWDSNYLSHIEQFDTLGCSRIYPFPDGAPAGQDEPGSLNALAAQYQNLVDMGYIQTADTLEGLAEKLGLPGEALASTAARYNELCAAGSDEDFGKEAYRMIALDSAPYSGVRMTGYPMATMDGIRIDCSMNALDQDLNPIAGLYVAGNDSGSFFAHCYPNLLTGITAGRTITFGRAAGKNAAAGEKYSF